MKRTFTLLLFQLIFIPFCLNAQPEIIWQKATGMGARDITFSPDSTEMATVVGQEIIIRDTKTAVPLRTLNVPLEPLTDAFYSIGWSPDGKFIAAATSYNVYYIDPHSGEILQKYDYSTNIQFSPGGKYILDRSYPRLQFSTQRVFTSSDLVSLDLSFEFDDILIMSGDSTALVLDGDSVVLRQFPAGEIIQRFELYAYPKAIAIHGGKLAILNNDSLIIFNTQDGSIHKKIQSPNLFSTSLLLFTPDSKKIVTSTISSDAELTMWDIETGNALLSMHGGGAERRKMYIPNNDILYFWNPTAFNPYLMSAGANLLPWDLKTGKLYRQPHHGHHARIRNLKFANKDENIISYGEDSTEITWDTKTGELISLKRLQFLDSTTQRKKPTGISPFGTYRLGFNDANGYLALWDNFSGKKLYDLMYIGSAKWHRILEFTPDERYSIACIQDRITFWHDFKIWDNATGEEIYSAGIAADYIAFAENNRYFAAFDTTGGGFIVWSGEDMATSIQSFKTGDLSFNFYPNPLKESSTISCSLPADGVLKITLHDMLGREVAIVHDAFKSAGNYTFPFKRENLPDGMYFLKMSASGRSLTKSVSIVR